MMWYSLNRPDRTDSPALLVYPERVRENINTLIEVAGDFRRLRPHVKTHKMTEVARMHLEACIGKFKCSTIAEAEMLALAGAEDVLLAYQPVGPRADRLLALARAYPHVAFGCLLDDSDVAHQLSGLAKENSVSISVWIDIDNGMGRSGMPAGDDALLLYRNLNEMPGLNPIGLHVYDGHIRNLDFEQRKLDGDSAFEPVNELVNQIESAGFGKPNVVAGGSPSFPVNALRTGVDLSPGTYVFWDAGYASICRELDFRFAAVVLTRVLSKPGRNRICLDVGSKGVSPDNPVENRIRFLNFETQPKFLGQSEEHFVVEVENADEHAIGDVWYGIPFHVCPTVNLYQEALIVDDGELVDRWKVIARDRLINY